MPKGQVGFGPYRNTFINTDRGVVNAGDIVFVRLCDRVLISCSPDCGHSAVATPEKDETPEQLFERVLEAKARVLALNAGLIPDSTNGGEPERIVSRLAESDLREITTALSTR